MGYREPDRKREYQRIWIANRRKEFFKNKKCVKCGSTENLELDHINPKDKVNHRIWSWCKERREAEIAKCQVLCSECHLEKTIKDIKSMRSSSHGTLDGYTKYHCRCEKCKVFKQDSPDQYISGVDIETLTI